jgi:OTU domain-containing protein 5
VFQEQNSDYYSQYVTEDIADYIERKRYLGVHGNHLEIQALSEMYNRPIHIYCYSSGQTFFYFKDALGCKIAF